MANDTSSGRTCRMDDLVVLQGRLHYRRGLAWVRPGGVGWCVYNQKADEFLRLIELPQCISVPLEICLAIHPDEADRVTFQQNGWSLTSPQVFAATPDSYRDYILECARGVYRCQAWLRCWSYRMVQ